LHTTIISGEPSFTATSQSHRKWHQSVLDAISFVSVPEPTPPQKFGNVGRKSIILSALPEDTIRYVFHQMFEEKIYPKITTVLPRLHAEQSDFPIETESTLLKKMKEIGFKYRKPAKITMALE
jgi:hypothetical protein